MEKPDWDSINRMVPDFYGQLRWKNSERNRKRKRRLESFTEDTSIPSQMENTASFVVPENNLLPVGWDDELLERLKPAKKMANHKRAPSLDDTELTFTQLQFSTTRHNDQEELHRKPRAQSEEPSTKACARQRRQRFQTDRAHLIVEHDESEMSRRSPGDRKHRRSLTKADVVDLSSDSEQPLGPPREDEDAEHSLEIEGVPLILTAKRVAPNSGQKVEESSRTPDLSHRAKSVSSGNAGRLRSGRLHGIEEANASTKGNARDQKDSDESKGPTKRKWDYFDSYKDRKPSSVRDYGNPSAAAPVPVPTASSSEELMAPIPSGGPKPVNRLSSSASGPNANLPYKKPTIPKEKFNEFEDKPRANKNHPNKRQKIEGTTVSRNGSSKSPINLEDEPTEKGKYTRTSTTRSVQSQSQTSRHFGKVEEFHNVEDLMRGRNPKNASSGSQNSSGRRGKQFLPPTSNLVRLDDATDPISEDDGGVFEVQHIKPNPSQSARKSRLEIQIPMSHQNESTTGYQGTSNRRPSRPMSKIWGNDDSEGPADTSPFSRYFPRIQNSSQRNNSNRSHSAEDEAPTRGSVSLMSHQARKPSTEKATRSDLNPPLDADVSLDELNSDAFNISIANTSFPKKRAAKAEKSKGTDIRTKHIAIEDFSDDDLANKKADMITTDFIPSSIAKVKKQPGEERYVVTQVFSKSDRWLLASTMKKWSLHENCKNGLLTIFDENGSPVPDLELAPRSITKIMRTQENSKVLLFKSIDQTAKGSSQIYLELSHHDDGAELLKRMKKVFPEVVDTPKDGAYLDKVFDTALKQQPSTMRKFPSSGIYDADVILAQKQSDDRHAAEWKKVQDIKRATTNGQRVIDQRQVENEESRSERNSRSRKSKTNPQCSDDDESPRNSKGHELPPGDFYGAAQTRRSSMLSLREIRPATRASERDRKPQQQRPRNPSPPLGWTTLNPEWAKEWHSPVIYPAEGNGKARVDKARVDMGDIKKLDEGEFLNDNLIIFYLRWLQNRLEQEHPDWAKRIFFQNTFFYERLTSSEKGKKGINYAAVERWTTRVNLLDYDYIIIPVNEHLHWYVAIICNASKLLAGTEVTWHSQSQDDTDALVRQKINTEDGTKTVSVSAASPKQTSGISKKAEVDIVMKDMSLDDQKLEDVEESEWPKDNLGLAPMTRRLLFGTHDGVRGDDAGENCSPGPASLPSNPPEPATLKASQTKRKRRSIPTPRKYNPKEFRIITLDSLGTSHTGACTHLKEYLVQEIKAKHNVDIPRPGSVGTTAKNIPLQTNFYDCGLFLLSYIEMFLKNPDEFISGILQHELDVDMQWPKVSEMRARIRDILFDLQKEQVAEADRLGKGKGQRGRVSQKEGKTDSVASTKASSREASKSARTSPDGRNVDESQAAEERTIRTPVEVLTKTGRSKLRKSALPEPPASPEPSKLNGMSRRESPIKYDMRKPDAPTAKQVHDLDAESQNSAKVSGNRFNDFLSNVTTKFSEYLNNDRSRAATVSKPTLSGPNIIEIQDSPEKVNSAKVLTSSRDSETQDLSRILVEDKHDVTESGSPKMGYVERQEAFKSRQQRGANRSRQPSAKGGRRVLASATLEAADPSYGTPGGHNVQDLISPSPEDVKILDYSQASRRIPSPEEAKTYGRSAEDRERATRAPSPDFMRSRSPGSRDLRPTPYPANGVGNAAKEVEHEFEGFADEIMDSADDDDEVDTIPGPVLKGLSKGTTEASACDAEMLLQSKGLQRETIEIPSEDEAAGEADPSFLTESPASSSQIAPASKKIRRGAKSLPSSPAQSYQGMGRTATISPSRVRKRKAIGESGDWQHHARPTPVLRDSSDQAIIGKHVGMHIRFD